MAVAKNLPIHLVPRNGRFSWKGYTDRLIERIIFTEKNKISAILVNNQHAAKRQMSVKEYMQCLKSNQNDRGCDILSTFWPYLPWEFYL